MAGQVEGVLPQVSAGHPAEAARGVPEEPAEDRRAAAVLLREEQGAAQDQAERELRQEPGYALGRVGWMADTKDTALYTSKVMSPETFRT